MKAGDVVIIRDSYRPFLNNKTGIFRRHHIKDLVEVYVNDDDIPIKGGYMFYEYQISLFNEEEDNEQFEYGFEE